MMILRSAVQACLFQAHLPSRRLVARQDVTDAASTSASRACSTYSSCSRRAERFQNSDPAQHLLDVQRAAIASACTYHDASWCRPQLQRYPSLRFTKVFFRDPESTTLGNMVMALANDDPDDEDQRRTLFVAIRGTKSFADCLVSLDTRHTSFRNGLGFQMGGISGQFHAGFLRRLDEMLPEMLRLAEYMQEESISRVVFCGHSLGGALAHMAFIKFMITMAVPARSCDHISISFGSPHFCDAEAKDFLKKAGLVSKMFTYINKDDPVPRLLDDIILTRKITFKYLFQTLVPDWIHASKWFGPSTSTEDTGSTSWASKVEFRALWVAIINTLVGPSRAPCYVPTSQRHHLPVGTTLDQEHPQQLTLTHSSLQCHNIGAYVQLSEVRACSVRVAQQEQNCPVDVQTIGPHIESCIMTFMGKHEAKKKAKIIIKGDNLSMFLRICVSTSSGRKGRAGTLRWSLDVCSKYMLSLNLENEVDSGLITFLTTGDWLDGALSLSITTSFGKSRQTRVQAQDPWFDSCTKCVISCCITKLFLMKSCGLLQSHGQEALSQLVKIFPTGFLEHISNNQSEDLNQNVLFAWDHFLDPVVKKLMEDIDKPKATLIEHITSFLFPCSDVQSTYYDCLVLLLQCLTNQIQNADQKENMPGGRKVSFYEKEIYHYWRQHNLHIEGEGPKPLPGSWEGVPEQTRDKLLEKGRTIYEVFSAHEHLGRVKTVIFVGPRFVGKSTLINCLLEKELAGGSKREAREEEEQQRWMTRIPLQAGAQVESFMMWKVKDEAPVMLVEVPGSWEKEQHWQHLVHLADLVVVVVSFAGDTAKQAEELSERVRRLCRCHNIVVVVNGMDRVLHGKQDSSVWEKYQPEYLAELHNRYSKRSRVSLNNVLMSVASNCHELEPTTTTKLEELQILFHNQITKALHERISKLHHHHHHHENTISMEQLMDQFDYRHVE